MSIHISARLSIHGDALACSHAPPSFRLYVCLSTTMPWCACRGLFLGRGLLPLQTPINIVVGAPIDVPRFEGDVKSPEGERGWLGGVLFCSTETDYVRPDAGLTGRLHRNVWTFLRRAAGVCGN
jgi:Diacylglycerol acyltransferase